MKTPMPDVDALVEALRGDLPSADDEARVRARLLATGVVLTSAAFTSASAGAPLGALGTTPAAASSPLASGVALGSGVPAVGGSSSAAAAASAGAAASGAAGVTTVGSLGAPVAAAKAGLLAKLLVLPIGAKVGAAAGLAVAVAATSVPLVLERTRNADVPAPSASSAGSSSSVRAPGTAEPARPEAALPAPSAGSLEPIAPQRGSSEASLPLVAAARSAAAQPTGPEPLGSARGTQAQAHGVEPQQSAPARVSRDTSSRRSKAARTERVRVSLLSQEASLMERAMLALGDSDLVLARRLLDEHARRFPHGLLAPERQRAEERVRALAELGDTQPDVASRLDDAAGVAGAGTAGAGVASGNSASGNAASENTAEPSPRRGARAPASVDGAR